MGKSVLQKVEKVENHANRIFLISFFAIIISAVFVFFIIFFLKDLPEAIDLTTITSTYNLDPSAFLPERHEFLQYALSTLMFPILFCVFFKLISMMNIEKLNKTVGFLKSAEFLLMIGFVIFGVFVLPQKWLQSISSVFTLLVLFLVLFFQMSKGVSLKIFTGIIAVAHIGVLCFISFLYLTKNYFINENVWHFEAYYYPVFEVFNGKTLMTDLNGLYGFYPYIIAPILKLFGQINMYNFSLIMVALVLITFTSIAIFLWQNTKNKIISLIGLTAVLYVANGFYVLGNNYYYLQYTPHRMIGSTLLILICSLLLHAKHEKHKKILGALGYVVAAFALFWNIDTGIVVVAVWCLFLLYQVILEHKFNEKELYIKSLKILGLTVIAVVSVFIILLLITLIRSGQIISLTDVLSGQSLFVGSGYFMLPMKFPHYWVLLILVYALGLVKSLRNIALLRSANSVYSKTQSSVYFLLSVIGLGLFSYYQGRSHDEVFNAVIWPGVILACLFVQEYISKFVEIIKEKARNLRNVTGKQKGIVSGKQFALLVKSLLMIVLIATFSVSFIVSSFNGQNIRKIINNTEFEIPASRIEALSFFQKYKGEQIDLITQYFEEYYTMLGLKNPMPFGAAIDWFTKEDYKKILNWLETTRDKVFIDSYCQRLLLQYTPNEFKDVMTRRFNLIDTFGDINVFEVKAY